LFRSIKAKVFLLIFGILAAVALVLMIFSKRAIESKIRDMEARSIRSTIHLVKLNIEDHYQNLLAHKIYVLKEHRIRMKSMASMLASNLEQLRNMADEGLIKAEAARQSALDWVRNMDFSGGTYFVISNSAGTLLAHPDKYMIGRDFSHLEDVKSLPVLDPKAHPERRSGHWFANFSWSGASSLRQFRNMGCFLYHRP
jgi:signal transduction histidine kinase